MSLFTKTLAALVLLAVGATETLAVPPYEEVPTVPFANPNQPLSTQHNYVYAQPTQNLKPWQMPITANPMVYPFAYGQYGGMGVNYFPYYSLNGGVLRYPANGMITYGPYVYNGALPGGMFGGGYGGACGGYGY